MLTGATDVDLPESWPPGSTATEPDPAPVRLLTMAVVAGIALDVGLRGGPSNVAVTVGVAILLAALLSDGRLRQRHAQAMALVALVPAGFLTVHASPWLAVSNLFAVAALVGLAVIHARSGSALDTSPRRIGRRVVAATGRGVLGVATLAPLLRSVDDRAAARVWRSLRAALIVLPLLGAIVALLGSADPVFARLVLPDVSAGPVLGHVALAATFALVGVGVAGAAAGDVDDRVGSGTFAVHEVVTMLALAAAVLGLFSISQLVALTGTGTRLVEASGLTPAAYARSGFFQLCWATAAVLALLALVRSLASPETLGHRAVRALGAAVPLLALGLVTVSLRRMALYDDAFGLTMLRLWVVGATIWMGAVLLMVAARNVAGPRRPDRVVGGALAVALAFVVIADLVDPEGFVVRHNVARARAGAELDARYLSELSDDAVPALDDAWSTSTEPMERDALLAALCAGDDATGAAARNLARAEATRTRAARC